MAWFCFYSGWERVSLEQHFANVRMGLAAHLEGLMNGIFLIALGAIWKEVHMSSRTASVVFWVTLYGTYSNWLLTTLAAVFGTAALSSHHRSWT